MGQLTGYHRKYLVTLLGHLSRRTTQIHRRRLSRYRVVLKHLRTLWAVSNYACGKRLVPMIPTYLAALRRSRELMVSQEERRLLRAVSAATVDRLLAHDRKRITIRGRSRTKPGTLLKHQIPIRTFTDWDDRRPGFLEIDSVHHCGDSVGGEYLYTLDATDVATGWNECVAHLGRGEYATIHAMETIEDRLPFPLQGVDFDTGGEFVNYHFIRWCTKRNITYTRAREGKKNDQNYVEQQNYSVVRRFVGYQRLETREQLQTLNHLYVLLSDYQNFFQPVMRLKAKVRNGTRVTRRYDKPKTAYQRVLSRPEITREGKQSLRARFRRLNPKRLLLEITRLGRKLASR